MIKSEPKGTKSSPKGQREPTRAKRKPKGSQKERKGAEREPKGDPNTKIVSSEEAAKSVDFSRGPVQCPAPDHFKNHLPAKKYETSMPQKS